MKYFPFSEQRLEVRLQLLQAGSCKLWPKLLSGNLLFLICCRFFLLSFLFCSNNKITLKILLKSNDEVSSYFQLMCLKSNRHINNGKYLRGNLEWFIVTSLNVFYWRTLLLELVQVPHIPFFCWIIFAKIYVIYETIANHQ